MPEVTGARSIYWMSNCRLHPTAPMPREALRAELKRRNVDTRPVFPAISQYPIWGSVQEPQPRARTISELGMNLPSGVCLTRQQVKYVTDTMRNLLNRPQ